jgi:hypothetical protein
MGETKMMKNPSFFPNDSARVPLVVIGIFLLILSTIISLNLTRMDIKMAKTMSTTEISAPDQALSYAQADLARALNYAALEAVKKLGETPVIKPDNNSEYYNGTNGDPARFNANWARAITKNVFDIYMETNYKYDRFVYAGYSVNVDPPASWDTITFRPIKMELNRTIRPPLMEPGNNNGYETYWRVSIPVRIHLKNLDTKTELLSQNITVETLITSRYPLLRDLTDEFSERVNGTNAVMTETTAFAMAYTWGRGYMQYFGKDNPQNIVNNSHLALIINGALLIDQGFVFNSVDPMSLVELVNQTSLTLSGKNKAYQDIVLDNNTIKIDPKGDAYNSTDDPDKAKEDSQNGKYDFNITLITNYLNNGSKPGGSIVYKEIKIVIPKVYSTTFSTGVARQTSETQGSHGGFEESYSIDGWGEPDSMTRTGIIPKDSYVPGNLFGETWELSWTRNHVWRHTYWVTESCGEECTMQVPYYQYMSTVDSRMDRVAITLKALENSNTNIKFDFSGNHFSSKNDVYGTYDPKDVTYRFTYSDKNLQPAYVDYRSIFDAKKVSNLKNMGLNGDTDHKSYTLDAPAWVADESQFAVDDITGDMIRDIHLDPEINYENYPVPSDLLNAVRDDFIKKIRANQMRYGNKSNYYSGKYFSASGKAISVVREWYVDQVMFQIREKFTAGSAQIDKEIEKNFSDPEKVKDANRNASKFLKQGLKLPFGVPMRAFSVDERGNIYPPQMRQAWNESVTLLVDQEPNFLDPEMPFGEEMLFTLKLRNTNLLGPNGVYILPTFEPWIATFNMWSIDVEGEYVKFEVQDMDNEAHPDPIFGHEVQVYVREDLPVEDSITKRKIGDNLPLKFNFTTGTFIVVPPGKLEGVGDKDCVIIEESTGFKVKK